MESDQRLQTVVAASVNLPDVVKVTNHDRRRWAAYGSSNGLIRTSMYRSNSRSRSLKWIGLVR